MNPFALIPLITTIAYIPLFIVLISSRPSQQRHTLFLLFLIPATLWSFITFLSMRGLLMHSLWLDVSIVISIAILVLVQFHYLVRSFYQSERVRIPLAYVFPIATIVLLASPIPEPVKFTLTGNVVHYGPGIIAIYLLFLCTVGVKDIYSLMQKRRLSADPAERNQIVYLFASIAIFTMFFVGGVGGGEFPIYHIGNLVVACILTYAVVTHRVLDVKVIARRAIMYVVLYGGGLGILLLIAWIVLGRACLRDCFPDLAIIIGLGIPTVLFLAHKVRPAWEKKVESATRSGRESQ